MAGQIGEVTEPGDPGRVWVAFNGDTWEWPIACLEIVSRKGIGTNWTTDRPTEPRPNPGMVAVAIRSLF